VDTVGGQLVREAQTVRAELLAVGLGSRGFLPLGGVKGRFERLARVGGGGARGVDRVAPDGTAACRRGLPGQSLGIATLTLCLGSTFFVNGAGGGGDP